MKKTLIVLLSVVAGLFFSCSNSSDTSTLMTVAVIQQQQAAEAAAVKSASVSVGDVYQIPDMTNGSDTYHFYYKVTSSTNVEVYIYKNDSTTPDSGYPKTTTYNTNMNGSIKIIQNNGKEYAGLFLKKGTNNTSFCTTWSISYDLSNTLSYQFKSDNTGVRCVPGLSDTNFTYTGNNNLYTAKIGDVEIFKVYYEANLGITVFSDADELTKVSGLPA